MGSSFSAAAPAPYSDEQDPVPMSHGQLMTNPGGGLEGELADEQQEKQRQQCEVAGRQDDDQGEDGERENGEEGEDGAATNRDLESSQIERFGGGSGGSSGGGRREAEMPGVVETATVSQE